MTRGYPDWFTPHRDSDYPFPAGEDTLWLSSGAVAGTGGVSLYSDVLDSDWDCFLRRAIIYALGSTEPFLARGEGMEIWIEIPSGYIIRQPFTDVNMAVVGSGTNWRAGATQQLFDIRVPANQTVSITLKVYNLAGFSDVILILSYIKEQSVL